MKQPVPSAFSTLLENSFGQRRCAPKSRNGNVAVSGNNHSRKEPNSPLHGAPPSRLAAREIFFLRQFRLRRHDEEFVLCACACACLWSYRVRWIGSPASPLSVCAWGPQNVESLRQINVRTSRTSLVVPLHFSHPLLLSPLPPPPSFRGPSQLPARRGQERNPRKRTCSVHPAVRPPRSPGSNFSHPNRGPYRLTEKNCYR